MKLKELFAENKIITADGAMGTYFSQLTGESPSECEKASVNNPEIIKKIHTEYINAGAKIIRTNTFSANTRSLSCSREKLTQIIIQSYKTAAECAGEKAVVCADISAMYDMPDSDFNTLDEYQFIADTFINAGAETFIFETVSEPSAVMPAIDYIKKVMPKSEIILSFTLLPDGKTRSGISIKGLIDAVMKNSEKLTAVGLNCGCGAAQLFSNAVPFFSYIHEHTDLFTLIMPNVGYPSIENQRTIFTSAPSYFVNRTAEFIPYGINAIGGCCGTTPEYIKLLNERINSSSLPKSIEYKKNTPENFSPKNSAIKKESLFSSKLAGNDFVNDFIIAAELDPPNNADLSKMLKAAKILKDSGVDIITVSDSPLGHAKTDSVICSARIKREIGIETLPHICCRDRNINALRSIIMGAYTEGIRSLLIVTGDHIAETDRGIIKPVFNIDSTKLMTMIQRMNEDIFSDSPVAIGGAFDPDAFNPEFALKRLDKKIECGAKFALTQPVFSDKAIEGLKAAKQHNIKILAGIMPMVSYRNASFMQNEVPGINIPNELVERFKPDMTREEAAKTGIEIACELAKKAMPYADGFYFMTPFNRAEIISEIIKRLFKN